jgi:flagellar biosynthesis chaperone FliJ
LTITHRKTILARSLFAPPRFEVKWVNQHHDWLQIAPLSISVLEMVLIGQPNESSHPLPLPPPIVPILYQNQPSTAPPSQHSNRLALVLASDHMSPKLFITVAWILALITLLCAVSAHADFVQGNLRQSSDQRRAYIKTASQRYQERISSRAHTASILTNPSANEVLERPSFASTYSQNRQRKHLEQHSMNVEASQKNLSPRQEYLKDWSKLSQTSQTDLSNKKNQLISLYHGSNEPWVQFDAREFVKFALNGPRPYWPWSTSGRRTWQRC